MLFGKPSVYNTVSGSGDTLNPFIVSKHTRRSSQPYDNNQTRIKAKRNSAHPYEKQSKE